MENSGSKSFVHLHLHTQYSLLEGAIRIPALMTRAKELGMPAVAMTDTNNLFGAIDFYFSAKDAGIKPIIGCEILYSTQGRFTGAVTPHNQFIPRFHHLVLLCKDLTGYQNLCQILTHAYLDPGPAKKGDPPGPREVVSRELLDRFGDGLVVLSGCLRGELSYQILSGEQSQVRESALWFQKRFGGDFYFELQDSPLPEQQNVNETLYALGKQLQIRCVATSDCHYLDPKDAEAHEILQCIEQGKALDIDRPKSLVPAEYYFKSAEVMRERFSRFEGACDATLEITDKCNLAFKFKDAQGRAIYHLPNFRPDTVGAGESFDLISYFRTESQKGLETRFLEPQFEAKRSKPDWPALERTYRERLEDELKMIEKTGFAGYFCIVADYINWAKARKIPVGPGRGSGAGSLVAYALKINDVDPIQFNLLFERFINPERISLPDFDIDFCQDRRPEVLEYVAKKYGAENVCQIITFGKLQARQVIKDVGRVLGLSFAETDQLTKLLPDELNVKIESAIEREPRLRDQMEASPKIRQVIEYALALEGLYRNAGVHAAGVIITESPVVTYCPLYVGKEGSVVSQLDKDFCEKIGLVKFDFLGLKTLTVIDHAIRLIRESEPEFDFERISYEDPAVYALVGSGDTDGVFQLESSGMKDLCTRLQPNSLEDLTAINAIYRPGPLGSGMVDDFIDCKHGRKPIAYEVPQLEAILKETYGVILYQEQVMQIARELAGYTLGQADMLRRAMGKKKAEEMAKNRELFVKGAIERGLPQNKAESIYDLMAKFAEYGFNKSHSAAYAVLTYQTAFLKAHYPAEFMAALMTTEINNTEKITRYIADARAHLLPVLPPDVNLSHRRFTVETLTTGHPHYPRSKLNSGEAVRAIRFGLEAIKGVGGIAVDTIIEARAQRPFASVVDFCHRVSTRKVNKKVLEALILAGAFDSIAEANRASVFGSIESLLASASDEQEERDLGQSSLFDQFSAQEVKLAAPTAGLIKQVEDWPASKKLSMEKQVVGFYVSGHPMDGWQKICEDSLGWNIEKIQEFGLAAPPAQLATGSVGPGGWKVNRKEVQTAGLITEMKEITTKKGTRMAFAQLEDLRAKIEVIFFPDSYSAMQEQIKMAMAETEPVILTAELEARDGTVKLLAKSLDFAKDASKGRFQKLRLKLSPSQINADQLHELKRSLMAHRGSCQVSIEFREAGYSTSLDLPKELGVATHPKLIASINQIFGADVVELR